MLRRSWSTNVRFSNRPVKVKRFQTIHDCGVDVTHGLVLLFGIGSKAVPSWDKRPACRFSGSSVLRRHASHAAGRAARHRPGASPYRAVHRARPVDGCQPANAAHRRQRPRLETFALGASRGFDASRGIVLDVLRLVSPTKQAAHGINKVPRLMWRSRCASFSASLDVGFRYPCIWLIACGGDHAPKNVIALPTSCLR